MNINIEYFKLLGITEYESRVYVTLIQFGSVTGYKASKLSGVPKANCYAALNSLVQKGFVYKVEGASSLYSARPFSEIRYQIEQEMEDKLNHLSENLKYIHNENQQFINVEGNKQIVEKLKALINSAKKSIYLDIWEEDLLQLLPHIKQAKKRGVKSVLVVIEKVAENMKEIASYVVTHHRNEDWLIENPRDFSIVVDKKDAFNGQIGSSFVNAVFSGNTSFVNLALNAFQHDLYNEFLKSKISGEMAEIIKNVELELMMIFKE